MPTSEESAPSRGFSDASVVSISVDHQVGHNFIQIILGRRLIYLLLILYNYPQ